MIDSPSGTQPPDAADPFAPFAARMQAEALPAMAIRAFERHYRMLRSGATGMLPESTLEPVDALPDADTLADTFAAEGAEALEQAVLIKLNGGLGTSMGLERAKSLLTVKDGLSFLDLIARQATASGCPLVLMNSFATRDDSLAVLRGYPHLRDAQPLDFVQSKVPKVDQRTLAPAEWPNDEQTWCPPGHGDIYTALVTSGVLDALLAAGRRYAFISNADNLGASLDLRLLGYVAHHQLPFLMEVADRTAADSKGGHLARAAGRLVLRESAQCPPEDQQAFQDIARHRFFNTNNIWLDLQALRTHIDASGEPLPLPLIRNAKTLDPRDGTSPPVYQLESAMGAAISHFEGAQALRVPRSRFVPVKTCSDLLRVRSDATVLTDDHRLMAAPDAATASVPVRLDPAVYRFVSDLDARFPHGPPSLVGCTSLEVIGDVRFGRDVRCVGAVRLEAPVGGVLTVPDHSVLGP